AVRRAWSSGRGGARRGRGGLQRLASRGPPTCRRWSRRSNQNNRRAVRRLRGFADPPVDLSTGGCCSEDPDSLGRPVGEEGLSDDPLLWDWSPEAAVVALPTIVAHHKKVTRRNLDRPGEVARPGCARSDEIFFLLLPVDDSM